MTTLFLEDSKEFITPTFSNTFGPPAIARSVFDGRDEYHLTSTAEYCVDESAFVGGPDPYYDNIMSTRYDLKDILAEADGSTPKTIRAGLEDFYDLIMKKRY